MSDEDKMSKKFNIISVCRDDIIQMIEDNEGDKLEKVMMIRRVSSITDHEMRWMASKLADGFCNCCFWGLLADRFWEIMGERNED